jgi:hypothetical protein
MKLSLLVEIDFCRGVALIISYERIFKFGLAKDRGYTCDPLYSVEYQVLQVVLEAL